MKSGEEFEIRCFEYLKKMYADKSSVFERKGGMDSTTSDIAVTKDGVIQYYIEVKDTTAQSGQFVVFADEKSKKFIFSSQNKSTQNEMTDSIMDYMNKNFERFNNAGTAGEIIEIDTKVLSAWIMTFYQNKNVKYMISYGNDYVIFPIRRFSAYFDITASYRIKKSGSSKPAKKDFPKIKEEICRLYPMSEFIEKSDKKLFVRINEKIKTDRFIVDKYEYYLSHYQENEYEIRKLSNTKNRNVIFKIKLKKAQDKNDLDEFESGL